MALQFLPETIPPENEWSGSGYHHSGLFCLLTVGHKRIMLMGDYGVASVNATKLVRSGQYKSPVTAWQAAVLSQFPTSKSSQNKGCPKGAYLGLCETDLVYGIPVGKYTKSQKNKLYAVLALIQLCNDPTLASNPKALWRAVGCPNITQNGQMDVVISLWNGGLLKCPSKNIVGQSGQESPSPMSPATPPWQKQKTAT